MAFISRGIRGKRVLRMLSITYLARISNWKLLIYNPKDILSKKYMELIQRMIQEY